VTAFEMALQVIILCILLVYVRLGATGRLFLAGAIVMIWLSFFAWAEMYFKRFVAKQGQAASGKLQTAPRPK
jgi:hypothetical protein